MYETRSPLEQWFFLAGVFGAFAHIGAALCSVLLHGRAEDPNSLSLIKE